MSEPSSSPIYSREVVDGLRATIATLTAQRDAAVAEADSLRDAIDHPYTSGVITRAEIAEARADAAEKVCEAVGRWASGLNGDEQLENALIDAYDDWRITKEGA